MAFQLPEYRTPDFSAAPFTDAPLARFEIVEKDGVAPEGYHGTSVFPEYLQITKGVWRLLTESRMDCVVVLDGQDKLEVKEFRRLKTGDRVAVGRKENAEEGIFVHTGAFRFSENEAEKFAFRSNRTRETSFSIDYDELYDLLCHERENGFILWVMGPAVVFDHDAREAFSGLISDGFVSGLMAGNALATHDIEGAIFGTALGQELYNKRAATQGHYKHLDALNQIRAVGSMDAAIDNGLITSGIMRSVLAFDVPYVLAGSIRDDGPLPEVVANVYDAQDRMRSLSRKATTVIALATQLHTIATGNMTPSYMVDDSGNPRPVYFYSVDMSEFAVNKLSDRGSLTAKSILTNVQDFVVTLSRGLKRRCGG